MNEEYKINSTTGNLDKVRKVPFPVRATPPEATEGNAYIDSDDHTLYVYYEGTWQSTGITFSPAAAEFMLVETGDYFLLETGDKIELQ